MEHYQHLTLNRIRQGAHQALCFYSVGKVQPLKSIKSTFYVCQWHHKNLKLSAMYFFIQVFFGHSNCDKALRKPTKLPFSVSTFEPRRIICESQSPSKARSSCKEIRSYSDSSGCSLCLWFILM